MLLCASSVAWGEVGSRSCRTCHQSQFDAQSATAHAASLSPPASHRLASSFTSLLGFKSDWAFGAGSQAVTFVSRLANGEYLEHGRSYFASLKRLAPTPGHAGLPGPGVRYPVIAGDAAILRCFQCHSTGAVRVEPGLRITPAEPGVRCESCHGPGDSHAAAPAKSNIVNPARYSSHELNQLCGSCHRKPAAAGSATDWSDPWNTRHQPLYLAESRCFLQSNGKLSCRTCHDPHSGAVEPGCASCHAAVKHRTSTGTRSCVSCHMPTVVPQPGLRFANHWIGVYTPGKTLRPR
ncbi:MAG: hypothetical protein FJW39_26205 [Acidobacteria bacterium]|nr:hypothetical protein [Acidobacteriota bacterium]